MKKNCVRLLVLVFLACILPEDAEAKRKSGRRAKASRGSTQARTRALPDVPVFPVRTLTSEELQLQQAQGYLSRGLSESRANNHSAALASFQAGLVLEPKHVQLTGALASELATLGRTAEARAAYKKAMDLALAEYDARVNANTRMKTRVPVFVLLEAFGRIRNQWLEFEAAIPPPELEAKATQ